MIHENHNKNTIHENHNENKKEADDDIKSSIMVSEYYRDTKDIMSDNNSQD